MGKWIAGCDICQEICPWNQQDIQISKDPDTQPKEWIFNISTNEILNSNDEELQKKLQGSSLKRIKPWMWRRNANYILKNDPLESSEK